MIYVFLADGFETVEALAVVDVLRRAKLEVRTAGVGGRTVTSAHGVPVVCDVTAGEVDKEAMELLFLPGGIPGTPNLEASGEVQDCITYAAEHDRWIAAICAAPSILGHRGLLEGRTATSFPTFQKELRGANIPADAYVCVDGGTSPGGAWQWPWSSGSSLSSCSPGKRRPTPSAGRSNAGNRHPAAQNAAARGDQGVAAGAGARLEGGRG